MPFLRKLRDSIQSLAGQTGSQHSLPRQERGIPYSETGSESLGVPEDLIGREAECADLLELLEEKSVIFLHGSPRIGKTYLIKQVAEAWKANGRPFLYTCPLNRGIGELFQPLGWFFWANGFEKFTAIISRPESNDDDKIQALPDPLESDRYLIILDDFGKVSARQTFRKLVLHNHSEDFKSEDFKGRLLICGHNLPSWHSMIPTEQAGVKSLGGFTLEDIELFAYQYGFEKDDLEGLDEGIHPFVLELTLYLAQKEQTPPGMILGAMDPENLEQALLTRVCQIIEDGDVLQRLSVLRLSFLPRAFQVFGGELDMAVGKPMNLLVKTTKSGQFYLHSFVKDFGKQRLREEEGARQKAHEQALAYYQPSISSRGKGKIQGACETAYHLLELGRPRNALDVLREHTLQIISFGYGQELLDLTGRVEASGLVERLDEPEDQAQVLLDLAYIYSQLPIVDVTENRLKAIRYCGRAAELFRNARDPVGLASALNVQGIACLGLPAGDPRKNVQRAFDSYETAMELFLKLGLPEGCATVHNNLGSAWMKLATLGGEWCINRAIGCFRQAVKLFKNGVDLYIRALVESNLGHALCLIGKVEEGMGYFQAALEHFSKAA